MRPCYVNEGFHRPYTQGARRSVAVRVVRPRAKAAAAVRYSLPMDPDPFRGLGPPRLPAAGHAARDERPAGTRRRGAPYTSSAPRGFWARRWEKAFHLGIFLAPFYALLSASSDTPHWYIVAGFWAGLCALLWLTLRSIRLRLHHRLRDHLASAISRVRDRI